MVSGVSRVAIDEREQEFHRALASLRMASLTSRRSMTSSAGIRRVLPFSVTAIFCLNDVLQDAPTVRLPFGRPFGLPLLPGMNCVAFGGRPIADGVIGGAWAFAISHGRAPFGALALRFIGAGDVARIVRRAFARRLADGGFQLRALGFSISVVRARLSPRSCAHRRQGRLELRHALPSLDGDIDVSGLVFDADIRLAPTFSAARMVVPEPAN